MEDIVRSDSITAWSRALYENAVHRNDHVVLTCDGTMKVCMGVRSRSNADVVFTVRGEQSFLFGTPLVGEKRAADVRLALEGVLRREHYDGVQWVVVDWCTAPLLEELRLLFRNFQSICHDTVHLVIKYKSAFGAHDAQIQPSTRCPCDTPPVSLVCHYFSLCDCFCACHALCVWRIFLVLPSGGRDAMPPPVYTGVAAVVQDSGYKDALMHCRKSSLPRDAVDHRGRGRGTMGISRGMVPRASSLEHCSLCRHAEVTRQTQDEVASRVGARGDACTLRLVCQQRGPAILTPNACANCSRHGNRWQ